MVVLTDMPGELLAEILNQMFTGMEIVYTRNPTGPTFRPFTLVRISKSLFTAQQVKDTMFRKATIRLKKHKDLHDIAWSLEPPEAALIRHITTEVRFQFWRRDFVIFDRTLKDIFTNLKSYCFENTHLTARWSMDSHLDDYISYLGLGTGGSIKLDIENMVKMIIDQDGTLTREVLDESLRIAMQSDIDDNKTDLSQRMRRYISSYLKMLWPSQESFQKSRGYFETSGTLIMTADGPAIWPGTEVAFPMRFNSKDRLLRIQVGQGEVSVPQELCFE